MKLNKILFLICLFPAPARGELEVVLGEFTQKIHDLPSALAGQPMAAVSSSQPPVLSDSEYNNVEIVLAQGPIGQIKNVDQTLIPSAMPDFGGFGRGKDGGKRRMGAGRSDAERNAALEKRIEWLKGE